MTTTQQDFAMLTWLLDDYVEQHGAKKVRTWLSRYLLTLQSNTEPHADLVYCRNDGEVMSAIYENNGPGESEGVSPQYELTHYKCPKCGRIEE